MSVIQHFCAGQSCPAEGCWDVLAQEQAGGLRGDSWPEKEDLEGKTVARTVPSLADNTHGGEGRRESYVGARQPLQESSAHIGRATGGGASATTTSATTNPKIEPKHQVQEKGHSEGVIRLVCRVKPFVQPQLKTLMIAESCNH